MELGPDPQLRKMLYPDPHYINADPQPCCVSQDEGKNLLPHCSHHNELITNILTIAGLRIRIHFIRIRIQQFRLNTDPDPDPIWIKGFNDQKFSKKTTIYLSLGLHKERPSYSLDPDSRSGSTYPIESGSNPDPDTDTQPCTIVYYFLSFQREARMPRNKAAAPSRLSAAERAGSTWTMGDADQQQQPGPAAQREPSPNLER